jgi:diguanylate cyclase (GGDEF)-like protein
MHRLSSGKRFVIVGIALVAIIAGAVVQIIAMERAASIEAFRTAATNLARGMSAQTELALDGVDAALRTLQSGLAANLDSPLAAGLLTYAQAHTPDAMAFLAADASARLIDAPNAELRAAASQAAREALAHFHAAAGNMSYVTDPARSDGDWVTFMARPIDVGGRLAGVVLAKISLQRWENFYRVAMPPRRTATLYRRDGTVLARYPHTRDPTGETLARGSAWHAYVEAGGGAYEAPDALDGTPVVAAVRPLRGMPLVIETSISQQEALAGWRSQRRWTALGGVLAAAGVVVLLRLFGRQINKLERSELSLAANNAQLETARLQFDLAVRNISQGLCFFSSDLKLIVCNPRYGQIYGFPPEITRPGTSLEHILTYSPVFRRLSDPFETGELTLADAVPSTKEVRRSTLELRDGRIISVVQTPLADGGWVATHEDVTERRQAEARVKYLARHDLLTGLPNRAQFHDRIGRAIADGAGALSFAVLFLDLDRFKAVNDTLGHPAGDELLKAVAARLKASVREYDTIARLGGDEFVILQMGISGPDDAAHLARRIIHAVGQPYVIAGQNVSIGVSVGIDMPQAQGTSAEGLLKNADMALYAAKEAGRGQCCFFTPAMDLTLQSRRELEADLRHAVAHGEFQLFYQPVIDAGNAALCGFEALLRWNHPSRGLVLPGEFIGVAEECGLIVPLSEWVLKEACRRAALWPDGLHVAVNLSPVHFRSGNVLANVEAALGPPGLAAGRLELEITEQVLLQGHAANVATLERLRGMGVAVSLDDFGTGASSLSSLREFAFDKVKINRSFVADLASRPDALCVVRAIVGLCSDLSIRTTVKGIETEAQLRILLAEGCSELQGFYFSQPRPAEDLAGLIARSGFIPAEFGRGARRRPAAGLLSVAG